MKKKNSRTIMMKIFKIVKRLHLLSFGARLKSFLKRPFPTLDIESRMMFYVHRVDVTHKKKTTDS